MHAPIIAHANFAKGFRGGERQTQLLIEQLSRKGFVQRLYVRKGSELSRRCDGVEGLEVIELRKPYALFLTRLRGVSLLHAHETKAAQFAFLAHRILKIPYLITRRVDHAIRDNRFNRRMYASAAKCVALSSAIEEEILKILPYCSVTVIPSAHSQLPCDADEAAKLKARFEGRFVVGQVGALVDEHKGQAVLIDAARSLSKSHPDMLFVLLGSGRDEAMLKARAQGLENVIFEGFVDNVGDYLGVFDLFAFPSRYEGLGSILFDAMQFNLPIVASRAGGIPDIVHDEHNGLLVPPGDAKALAAAITRLYSDAELRRRLSENALRTLGEYAPEKMAERYVALYESVLTKAL